MSLFTEVISRQLLRRELSPPQLSSLLFSHVRLLHFDGQVARLAAQRLGSEDWPLEDLATSLQALATFRALTLSD